MRRIILLLSIVALFFSSCLSSEKEIVIAISKAKPIEYYGRYSTWIKSQYPEAQIINMYELGVDSALKALDQCHGLVVSGGADVYPEWYGKIEDTARCGSFDRYRDTLEIELIRKAIENKMPLLGICRGEQIINVALGGSLIIDIPTDHDTTIKHRQEDWENCFHEVVLEESGLLKSLTSLEKGVVNSNHHQAIDSLAKDLKVTSRASDGIIESIEWNDQLKNKGFMIAVQWHPERLDTVHPELSIPILNAFMKEAYLYSP